LSFRRQFLCFEDHHNFLNVKLISYLVECLNLSGILPDDIDSEGEGTLGRGCLGNVGWGADLGAGEDFGSSLDSDDPAPLELF
jgi:hypothetical protein